MTRDRQAFWKKIWARSIVESLPLLTAFSFLVSAGVNALMFYAQFKMNYFAVAQPSDIIMSGFIYVTLVAALCGLGVVTFLVYHKMPQMLYKISDFLVDRMVEGEDRRYVRKTLGKLTILLIFLIANILASSTSIYILIKSYYTAEETGKSVFTGAVIINGAVSNLHLGPGEQFASCGQAPVVWMGSASVIVNCRGRLRLIQNTENLVLDRLSDSETAAIADAEANRILKVKADARAEAEAKAKAKAKQAREKHTVHVSRVVRAATSSKPPGK